MDNGNGDTDPGNGDGREPAGDGDVVLSCTWCGEPLEPSDRFCEACGRAPYGPRAVIEIPEIRPEAVLETSSRRTRTVPDPVCGDCGGTDIDAEGYCGACGLRQPTGNEHVEIELAGPATGWVRAAGISDLGHRRGRNEDAVAMAALPRTVCAVVCDGVASAPGSDRAAQVAADTGVVTLAERLVEGDGPEDATRGAVDRANRAVTGLAASSHNPPACTYVSAVVGQQSVTIGWVGDSRAYWIPFRDLDAAANGSNGSSRSNGSTGFNGHASALLTRDDSWADLMIARRTMTEAAARSDPRAHLLTGWLGADADAFAPHAVTFRPRGPGMVLICSDGLWNHLPEPSLLEEVLIRAATSPPVEPSAEPSAENDTGRPGARLLPLARSLVQAALDEGGHDNVTVALIPYPPRTPAVAPAPTQARSPSPDAPDGTPREPPR
ncbi:protein phosphatase 2C domain-containing protein [Spirillospora sp. CA-255316]